MPGSRVYLDWNATAPLHPAVVDAMARAMRHAWANPASVHRDGQRARAELDAAREAVAALLGFAARDVVLTSGGTEANNLALRGLGAAGGAASLVTTAIEHPSVLRTAEALARETTVVVVVPAEPSGRVAHEAVAQALDEAERRAPLRLVSVQAANHETGVVQSLDDIGRLVHTRGALLHVDAVQAVGKLGGATFDGADAVTITAHKLRGPKGIGALALRRGIRLAPLLSGGGQERGLRPGTQDAVAAAGLAAACRRAGALLAAEASLGALRDRLERAIRIIAARHGIEAVVNGTADRLPHVSNLSLEGWIGAELCAALDLEGVSASSGAACSAGTPEPSAVVTAMSGVARAQSAIRLSLGEETTLGEIDQAIAAFERVLARRPA